MTTGFTLTVASSIGSREYPFITQNQTSLTTLNAVEKVAYAFGMVLVLAAGFVSAFGLLFFKKLPSQAVDALLIALILFAVGIVSRFLEKRFRKHPGDES